MKPKALPPKQVPFSQAKAELSGLLSESEATGKPVVILRHGKPAGALIGFSDEDDYFDWRLEYDPAFREKLEERLAKAADEAKRGQLTSLADLRRDLGL